jgi:glycosyltransferase involved in cell wall biosynthesis
MNIQLVTGIFPPDIGGPAHFIPTLQDFLQKSGARVQVLTLAEKSTPQIQPEFITRIERKGRLTRFIKVVFKLASKSNGTDVYLASGLYEETALVLRFMRKPGIARIVGDPIWERHNNSGGTRIGINEFNETKLKPGLAFQRQILRWSLNQFTLIVCPSKQLQQLITGWGVNTEIRVIKNGIPIKKSTLILAKNANAICAARLVRWKNLDKVIEICRELELELSILGDGEELPHLRDLSDTIGARVHFKGKQPEIVVQEELALHQYFFMLSDYEGQSFALTKAMAEGLFCIVSDIPGNTEIIKHLENGFVLRLSEFKESVSELKNLLLNVSEVEKIRREAIRSSHESFDEQVQLRKLSEILESCLKK